MCSKYNPLKINKITNIYTITWNIYETDEYML